MTEAQTQRLPAVRCEYLKEGGVDLADGLAAFVLLDLVYGTLRAYSADEYAKVPPPLVGASFHMRWPIARLPNDRANELLNKIAPGAEALVKRSNTHGEAGVILKPGAGTAIDAIQRACAETWTDPTRLPES